MQSANSLCITSLDQLSYHGGFGRVVLGFHAVDILCDAVIQNSLHAYSHFYILPSKRRSECSTKPLWRRGRTAKRSCCPVAALQVPSATAFSIRSGRNNV